MTLAIPAIRFALTFGPNPRHDPTHAPSIEVSKVNFWYGAKHALADINLTIYEREVMAFIGPSGCGKTTLLRCLNRTADIIPGARMTGEISLNGVNL